MSETSLLEVLQRASLPSRRVRLSILRQVAEVLDAAHRRGTLHGHLTPQSIVISEDATREDVTARVNDFGTKFILDNEVLAEGLPYDVHYISPEQILGIDIDERSDQFSFGVIAYEVVCHRQPFDADAISPLFYKICTEPPEPVQHLDSTLSEEVNEVFKRVLAKKPERRYLSCNEFVTELLLSLSHCEGWANAVAQLETPAYFNYAPVPPPPPPPAYGAQYGEPAPYVPPTQTFVPPTQSYPAPLPPPPTTSFTPGYDLPPLGRRRRRWEDEEDPRRSRGTGGKLAITAIICLLLAGVVVFAYRWFRSPVLETQVIDTANAPVTPPPGASPATDRSTAGTQPSSTSPVPDASGTETPGTNAASTAPSPDNSGVNTAPQNVPPPVNSPSPSTATVPAPPVDPRDGSLDRDGSPDKRSQYRDTSTPTPSRRTQSESAAGVAAAAKPARAREPEDDGMTSVDLLTEPPGGMMIVDDNSRLSCRAPCTLTLSNGRHTLRVQTPGYAVEQRVFSLPEDKVQLITLGKQTGALLVTSDPAASTILVDGTDYGLTPKTLHLPPGQHQLSVLNGSQKQDVVVNIVPDAIQARSFKFGR